MTDFDISWTKDGDEALVICLGELDLASAPEAETSIREAEATGVSTIVLDLRKLEFLDSTGLRIILAADARARVEGRHLRIVPGPEPVHRVFRIALLDHRLEFVDPADGGGDG